MMITKRLLELTAEYQDICTAESWQIGDGHRRSLDEVVADYEEALGALIANTLAARAG